MSSELAEPRQAALLDAAVGVFARYGYRKTSMDEVARAAGVSRQGLYLQFANKEELFRKAVEHSLDNQLKCAVSALSGAHGSLQHRLVAACDAWSGKFVGSVGADASDLMCASTSLAGAILSEYEAGFEAALADAIDTAAFTGTQVQPGLSAPELARVLHAAVRGFKQRCASREEFVESVTIAAKMLCAPLRPRK